ncbi:response regulator [Peribacillus loiseleuriae]|uniref:response regulator transcription factor n=1 Tax=Peribacillus loiseleuriae TaxID=1679170 RepID=UPI003800CF26
MWKAVIIDDDRQVLRGMRNAIPWGKLGIECIGEGADGEAGFEIIMEKKPDIVLTDIYMPVMNGLEMLQRLRENGFEGKTIILSGYSDFEYARKALRLNVYDYLSKPMTIQTIESVLAEVITQLEEDKNSRNDQANMKGKLEYYQSFISKSWLKSVMIGIEDQEPIQMFQQKLNLKDGRHIVIGIQVEKEQEPKTLPNPFRVAFQKVIKNIQSESVFVQLKSIEWIELNLYQSAILLSYEKNTESKTCVDLSKKVAVKLFQCMQNFLSVPIHFGIGGLKDDWHEISNATEEALYVASISSPNSIHRYEEISEKGEIPFTHKKSEFQKPVQFYRELAEAVKFYQKDQALELLENFMNRCTEMNNYLPYQLKSISKELWVIFTYCLYDNGVNLDELFDEKKIVQQTDGLKDLEQFQDWLVEKITTICDHHQMKDKENIRHKQAVEYMIQYIHEHYSENITLNDLSERVYISRNYLSQMFKKATGQSFNHYVNKVRMEKAKFMIIEGNYLIYEVAEKVGFKNTPYFSSLFKKYMGVNPTELLKQ